MDLVSRAGATLDVDMTQVVAHGLLAQTQLVGKLARRHSAARANAHEFAEKAVVAREPEDRCLGGGGAEAICVISC